MLWRYSVTTATRHVLRHVLGARAFLGYPDAFPLAGEFFPRAARKIGGHVRE